MKVAVVGVGLIGGSVGLAARQRLGAHVVGYDPSAGALDAALTRGAIVEACPTLEAAVADADFVCVAAPVQVLAGVIRDVLAVAGPDCVVTDVGSVKRIIVQEVGDHRFIVNQGLDFLGTKLVQWGEPRTWGLELKARL